MIGELNSNECDNNGLWEVVFDVRKHRMEADYRRVRAETTVEEPALAGWGSERQRQEVC